MLVMGCRGNVGVVSRAVVESQDGVSGTGRRGRMDRERGDGEVYWAVMAARVRCKAGVVNDEKEESNVREQAQAVMVVVVAGDVRRFGGDAMRCCVLQQPVYSSARALDDANDDGSS